MTAGSDIGGGMGACPTGKLISHMDARPHGRTGVHPNQGGQTPGSRGGHRPGQMRAI
jgi:hypothetical protein